MVHGTSGWQMTIAFYQETASCGSTCGCLFSSDNIQRNLWIANWSMLQVKNWSHSMCLSTNNPKYSSDVTLIENKQKIICVSVRTRSGLLCQNDVDFRCFSALLFFPHIWWWLATKKPAQNRRKISPRNRSLLGTVPVGTNELLIPVETPRGIFSNFAARCRKTKGFRENQGPITLWFGRKPKNILNEKQRQMI